ncbi:MAG: T9SS type A sorting domain-containing protein [Bacteroidia bacterium]
MRILLVFFLAIAFSLTTKGQPPFTVSLQEVSLDNAIGVHSYSNAVDGSKVLIIGGRTDGLHKRRPFEAFLENDNNKKLIVIDLETKKTYSSELSQLPTALYEQLQSTNQEFEQHGDYLYVTGGYGYSATERDHITYPSLVKLDYKKVIDAIINAQDPSSFFSQVNDTRFAVTGGYLHNLNDTFYLVGGQKFTGRYNPMGPDHGPGFEQDYTNEIRIFTLNSNGEIDYYKAIKDTDHLHRRDYNVVLQKFPKGEIGMTAFTGVFQYDEDIPWLNVVDIKGESYNVVKGFEQKLNQYHSAHLPVYDSSQNAMHTFFFGGMAQFTYQDEVLVEDTDVPFVKTISAVSRDKDGKLSEFKVGEMPGFLGSGAEFIPASDKIFSSAMLQLNRLNNQKTLVGYIFGGIESDEENIFFTFDVDKLSRASNKLFAVYVDFNANNTRALNTTANSFDFELFPNPATNKIFLEFEPSKVVETSVEIYDGNGKKVLSDSTYERDLKLNLRKLENGTYLLIVRQGNKQSGKVLWKY